MNINYEELKAKLDQEYQERIGALMVVCGMNGENLIDPVKDQTQTNRNGKLTMSSAVLEFGQLMKKNRKEWFTLDSVRDYLKKNYSGVFTRKQLKDSVSPTLANLVRRDLKMRCRMEGDRKFYSLLEPSGSRKVNYFQEGRKYLKNLGGWSTTPEFALSLKKRGINTQPSRVGAVFSNLALRGEVEKRGGGKYLEYKLKDGVSD